MKDLSDMLKQAQKMQQDMSDMQASLEAAEIEGMSGGGLVKVVLNGKGEMKSITLDPTTMVPSEAEIVEDLIVAAHADARARVETHAAEEMKKVTGGLSLPPGMSLNL